MKVTTIRTNYIYKKPLTMFKFTVRFNSTTIDY